MIIVFAGVLTLIFYFTFKPTNGSSIVPIQIEDIVVEVDNECAIKYNLSVNNATVKFSITDENIAVVNNNLVIAKKVGVTLLNATVIYGESSFAAFAQIKVIEKENNDNTNSNNDNNESGNGEIIPGLSDEPDIVIKSLYYTITPVQNCKFENEILYIDKNAIFVLELFVNMAKTIPFNYKEINIIVPEGVKLERELNNYMLSAESNGFIYLTFPENGYNLTVNFELIGNSQV